jgi:hypothetical protein
MRKACLCLVLAVFIAWQSSLLAHASGLTEQVMPSTTKGVLTITDVTTFVAQWEQTQLCGLFEDPVLQPFREDLVRQFEEEWTGLRERLGIELADVQDVCTGEFSTAMIRMESGEASMGLLMEVTDNTVKADAFLATVAQRLVEEGAEKTMATIEGVSVTAFDLPRRSVSTRQFNVYYARSGNHIIASDQLETLTLLLNRYMDSAIGGGSTIFDGLGSIPAYQVVKKRCIQDMPPGSTPQVVWFIDPFGYAEAIRDSLPADSPSRNDRTLEMLQEQGFDAVQGVGGLADLSVMEGVEMMHRTFIYAPKPHTMAMQMVNFINRSDFTPETWVPRSCAKYSTFYLDPLAAFDNFGTLFDAIFAPGETGVWDDIVEGIRDAENGPQVDLRSELVELLSGRVSWVVDYKTPITPESERMVIAIETTDEETLAQTIESLLKDDREVRRYAFDGHIIWKTEARAPRSTGPKPVYEFENPLVPEDPFLSEGSEEPIEPFFPEAAICVAKGHLFLASRLDFLLEILDTGDDPRESLAGTIDYQIVDAAIKSMGGESAFAISFERTDESYRPTYEMIRENKMPESKMLLAQLLNMIMPTEDGAGIRATHVDGSKLPEFEQIRRHFGPAGAFSTAEEEGWFIKGFLLTK